MFFLRATDTQTFSWQSSWWWKLLRILFPTIQSIICQWISRYEGIHVLCDGGQITEVINLKKQPKNSRFYSLVSFTKSHEKPWKRKHSSYVSPNISSLEDKTKSPSILICNEKKNQIFYMLWQYKLDKKNWSKEIFVIFNDCQKICVKMLIKSLVYLFQSTEFSSWDWKTLKLVIYYNHFLITI